MKVIKPQRLSLLQRVVEHGGSCNLVVGVLAWVPLDAPRQLCTEQELWITVGEESETGVIDEGMPKPRSEVLVTGKAFAVGEPAGAVMTRLRVGERLDKQLAVLGERYWLNGKPSDPVPFDQMPIDWGHAFGGEGFDNNPLGKGLVEVEGEGDAGAVLPLPNVEDPKALIASRGDRPEPAGFGAYQASWPQRFSKMGTYDSRYLETRFPGPAEDFDAHYYNTAPPDQQLEGMFVGDETFVLEGMHPSKAKLEGQLERFVVRAFVTQRSEDGEERFVEIPTRIDTIHFFPHRERACLVFRGTHPIADDDADDIVHLVVGAEAPDQDKPVAHYQHVLAKRLNKDGDPFASMQDQDLMPPEQEGWAAVMDAGDLGEMTRVEMPGLDNAMRGRKREMEAARDKMREAGFDPDEHGMFVGEDPEPLPDAFDFDAVQERANKLEAQAQEQLALAKQEEQQMLEDARQKYADWGRDFDAEQKQQLGEAGKPPDFSADEHLAMLHDMSRMAHEGGEPMEWLDDDITDPAYEAELRELEVLVRKGYRLNAHMYPETNPLPDEERDMLRVRVTAACDAGESLAKQDLTGADLSGMDLSEMDLSEAYLADTKLVGTSLRGANLRNAVLARVDLSDADLSGANLDGANLGATKLVNTRLCDCSMIESVLHRCECDGATFTGAKLAAITFLDTKMGRCDWSHIEAVKLVFIDMDLTGLNCCGAQLLQCVFMKSDLRGVDFTGSTLTQTQLLASNLDGCDFAGADMTSAVCIHETSMARCNFAGANMAAGNYRKTPLTEGDFEGAILDGADLSACDLRAANLHQVRARQSMWVRSDLSGATLRGADLLEAFMSKAVLYGADLTGANLSRADLSRVRVDAGTKVDEALMLDTRVHPKHEAKA